MWTAVVAGSFAAGAVLAGRPATGSVRVINAGSSSSRAGCPRGSTLNIVAHEDDDLLFLSPDLLHDIRSGKCVRTIFITAGDAADDVKGGIDQKRRYWLAREAGNRAAYALMRGVKDSWKKSHIRVLGHRIVLFTLAADPRISEINLRLPDGYPSGTGSAADHYESLQRLRAGEIGVIHAIDGSTSYTKAGLLATVTDLVQMFHPNVIRTQNYVAPDFDLLPRSDHSDHVMTAELAHAASNAYSAAHAFVGYIDYDVEKRPANLSGPDLAIKQAAFYLYDRYDSLLPCYTAALRAADAADGNKHGCVAYATWLSREYRVSTGPGWYQPCLVPEVSGTDGPPEITAEAQIRAAGCSVGTVTHDFDDVVPQDYVIVQDPEPSPTFLPQGTKVNLTVSDGPENPAQPQSARPAHAHR